MKKILFCVSLAALIFIAGCSDKSNSANSTTNTTTNSVSNSAVSSANNSSTKSENSSAAISQNNVNSNEAPAQNSGSKILIAYFAVAENSDVDAVASASVSEINGVAKGRLQALAEMIQSETSGDLFSIKTSVKYSGDIGKLIDFASDEQAEDARPELTAHIENLDQYDTIFVGYPTWWYDLPQVMYSFFDEYDFSGKTIVPFNSANGSRFSGTIGTIKELEPNANVIENGLSVHERDVPNAAADVAEWVKELGY